MKRKLLFAMLCIVGALGSWAQTDYTSSVKTGKDDWGGTNTYGVTVSTADGRTVQDMVEYYGSSETGVKLTQTISSLPSGMYEAVLYATSQNAWSNHSADLRLDENDVAYVFGTGKYTLKTWLTAKQATSYTTPEEYTISNIPVTDGTLTLGLGLAIPHRTEWQTIQIKSLSLTGTLAEGYASVLADAKTVAAKADKMAATVKKALNTAISTYQSVDTNDETAVIAAMEALKAATDAAEQSIASYAIIDQGTIATNVMNGWIGTNTNGFHVNTWSNEGATDGTNMGTPFIENWLGSGGKLGEGKLYYKFTNLEPGEKYAVSARIRVLREDGGELSDVTFYVNNETKAFLANSSACTNGQYGVLSLTGEVDTDGVFEIGINIPAECANNWISFKDVTIAEATGNLVTDITLSESSLALKYTESTTLTATVAPDNADDKTYTWSSSDEKVVTVSAAGVVTAVGIGTTTITCTANDGSEVNATCEVTVSDVTPAAAPAYYSEVAEGDFYIVNAATGLFLGGANSWGTQASIIKHGIPFTLTKVSEGVYTFDSHTYNGDKKHFLNGEYIDGESANVYVKALSDGKYAISSADGSAFYTAGVGNTTVSNGSANTNSTLAQWYFLSKNDRDKALAAATEANPADATYYIKEANISRFLRATYGQSGWTNIGYGEDKNQKNENYTAEVYNAAVDVYQMIENIPNGTYTVRMQGFTSGTDVKLYANDVEVDVLPNSDNIGKQSTAAQRFLDGDFVNTLSVTVTDRTLKIGLKGDCSGNKWLCYDNFELFMTAYTANTGVTADDVELQIGNTASLNAATDPATASFNKLTFASADESIATVDAAGNVTGVAVGETTVTVTANEMENFSKEVKVTVKLVTPTALALSETEVALNAETTTATLTVTPTPEGANTAVNWTSSDETIATVANGVVTAVSTGSATITATSIVDENVKATAEVTVTFTESIVPESYYVNDGATRTIYTIGENLIKNGSFDYPNAVYGWQACKTDNGNKPYSVDADINNFTITATGGVNNGAYITTNGAGTGSAKTLCRAIPVEVGKTYYFSVYTSGKAPGSDNFNYNALFKMTDATTENGVIKTFEWPQGAGKTATEWSKTECTFTAESSYVGVRMGWNEDSQFDNFVLAEVTSTTVGNVEYATAAIPTANIGTGAFQYSQDAINAANALVQGTATVAEVEAAYEAVTTVNEPADDEVFNVMITTSDDYGFKDNPLTFNVDNTSGAYFPKNTGVKANRAQQVKFTKVEGNKYTLSMEDKDGTPVYIRTNATNKGGNGTNVQIRLTTVADNALAIQVVPTSTEGVYNLLNTEANAKLGCQDNPSEKATGGIYTVNAHSDFTITAASKPSVAVNLSEGKYGTRIFPFKPEAIDGVKFYSCEEVEGSELTLNEIAAAELAANTPYILEATKDVNETLTGYGAATKDSYEAGLLTGVFAETEITSGYVLQTLNEKQAFYAVDSEAAIKVPEYRAYLTVPAAVGDAKAFFFGGDVATGIETVAAEQLTGATIYNLAGQRVEQASRLRSGIYIVNGKKVLVK